MGWKGTMRTLAAVQARSQRESVRRQNELQRQMNHSSKLQEEQQAEYEYQLYENYVDILSSIHKDCGNIWNWNEISTSEPPIKPDKSSENERKAQAEYDAYKPSISDKLLKKVVGKQAELVKAIEEGRNKDEEEYQNALKQYEQDNMEWENTCKLASKVLSGDVEAYMEAIKQIQPFKEITQLGSQLNIRAEDSRIIEATLQVKGEDVIPGEVKSLTKSGKLSVKKISTTKFYELYQDYVCGAVIRVARELFALLPVELAIVTAVGGVLNPATGHIDEQPILSAAMPRETIDKLNFEMLDPSDSLVNFVHNIRFQKAKGFSPVEKILPSRFLESKN